MNNRENDEHLIHSRSDNDGHKDAPCTTSGNLTHKDGPCSTSGSLIQRWSLYHLRGLTRMVPVTPRGSDEDDPYTT